MMKYLVLLSVLLSLAAARGKRCPRYKFIIVTDTSKDAAGLSDAVHRYQNALGGVNNGDGPGVADGFRQINWDAPGVPFDMPGNFFDATVPRGAIFDTKTGEFRVSNPPDKSDDRFDSIVGDGIAHMFVRFSEPRLFSPLNSNLMSTTFRVPQEHGGGPRATVTGFGSVFTDVDLKKTTSLTYFDRKGCLIAKLFVPPRSQGLSFAGLVVLDPHRKKPVAVIAKVILKFGNIALKDAARSFKKNRHFGFGKFHKFFGKKFFFHKKKFADVVVADDFIYGEPQKLH